MIEFFLVVGGATTAFAYDDAHALVTKTVGGTTTSYAYDGVGRMTLPKALSAPKGRRP